ncbi:thiol reductant ABC exporter subunit CydC [Spiribacter insolitus]|uniref:Thiol reductant ABC exporter subunit CydC n=1 Tax=Spiribacter insolitus TaxID=3122417 RepID=A0ABV3T7Z8_9GAMM
MNELRPYLSMLRPYRGRLLIGAALMLVTAASGIGLLALSGWFITATAVTGALLAAGIAARLDIYVPGGGIRTFAVTRTVARYFERVFNHDVVLRLLRDLRGQTFSRLANLSPSALGALRSGELLNRLTTDIDRLDGLYLRGLAPPLVAGLAILITGALLAIGSVTVALTAGLILATAGALIGLRAWSLGQALTRRLASANANLRAQLVDHLRGLTELKAFGSVGYHRKRVDRLDEEERAGENRLAAEIATGEAILHGTVQLVVVGVLLAALSLFTADRISGAVAVMMPLAVLALLEPLGVLPGSGLHLARARASAQRLDTRELDATPSRHETRAGDGHGGGDQSTKAVLGQARSGQAPDIRFESVTLRRGAGAKVLDELNLVVGEGEHVGVIGASGCGKSSLANLVAGWLVPDSGRVSAGGEPVEKLVPASHLARLGYLTQHTDLFSGTIAGNLRVACPDASDARLWSLLEALALDEFVAGCPNGIDTWIGESGLEVSGGQARRLALGRVMLREATIVVLDEPLSGLDEGTAAHVSLAIKRWLAGRTAIVLGHEPSAIPSVERVLQLRTGRLTPV